MESVINYQTEIRIADLLEIMETDKCKYYICHNVAFMLRDRIAEIPGYQQFETIQREKIDRIDCDEIDCYQETNAIPYYFITDDYDVIKHHNLTPQVVSQLNVWVRKFNPVVVLHDDFFDEYKISMVLFGEYSFNERGVRTCLLRKIVAEDPNAVLSIRL